MVIVWKEIWNSVKIWTQKRKIKKKCCRRLKELEDKCRSKDNAFSYGFGLKDNIEYVSLKHWRDVVLPQMSLIYNRDDTQKNIKLLVNHMKRHLIDRRTEAVVLQTLRRLQRERQRLQRLEEWNTKFRPILQFFLDIRSDFILATTPVFFLQLIIAFDLFFGVDSEFTSNLFFFHFLDVDNNLDDWLDFSEDWNPKDAPNVMAVNEGFADKAVG